MLYVRMSVLSDLNIKIGCMSEASVKEWVWCGRLNNNGARLLNIWRGKKCVRNTLYKTGKYMTIKNLIDYVCIGAKEYV